MDDSVAIAAIRDSDPAALARLLEAVPDLAASRLNGIARGRTPLHIVSDWPGYFPNGPAAVASLIDAGADPNARSTDDEHGETPLHWTASSDDADVAVALIDGERRSGDAWRIYRDAAGQCGGLCLLACRSLAGGPRRASGPALHAATLGMLGRLEDLLVPGTGQEQISQAFWHAGAAGQRRAAERLLNAGADLSWVPDYADGTALDAAAGLGTRQDNMIDWLRALGAQPARA